MAGIPPLLGFVAKEASLDALGGATLATVVAGGTLTVAYAIRFSWRPFLAGPGPAAGPPEVSPPGRLLLGAAAVLAFAGSGSAWRRGCCRRCSTPRPAP